MNSDKELLELAARAANMGKLDFDYPEREGHGWHMGPRLPMPTGVLMAAMHSYWNPDTDDGDNRRLQVALKISLDWHKDMWTASHYVDGVLTDADHTDPKMAILLVAAEIGKSMKEGV